MPNFSSLARLEVPEKFLWVGWVGFAKSLSNPTVVLRLGWGWGFDNSEWVSIAAKMTEQFFN